MKYAISNNQRFEATPKASGVCPCCGALMVPKCGSQKVWHWAHKSKLTCDTWWERETEWHRSWKDKFPKDWQEVLHFSEDGEKHIADVKTPDGIVVEFQHSKLNHEERKSRERFYKNFIWVVDGTRLKTDFKKFDRFRSLVPWRTWKLEELYDPNIPLNFFPSFNFWKFSPHIVLFDWGVSSNIKSEYWADVWESRLVGKSMTGWFVIERENFVDQITAKKGFLFSPRLGLFHLT